MEQSGGEQEPGAVRYRALEGPREGKKETRGRAAESRPDPDPSCQPGLWGITEGLARNSGPGTSTPLSLQAPGLALGRRAAPARPALDPAAPAAPAAARQSRLPGARSVAPGEAAPLRRRSGEPGTGAPPPPRPRVGTTVAPPPGQPQLRGKPFPTPGATWRSPEGEYWAATRRELGVSPGREGRWQSPEVRRLPGSGPPPGTA